MARVETDEFEPTYRDPALGQLQLARGLSSLGQHEAAARALAIALALQPGATIDAILDDNFASKPCRIVIADSIRRARWFS